MINSIAQLLPKAAVRKVIALALTCTVVYLALTGQIRGDALMAVYGTVLGFYFGEAAGARMPGQDAVD